MESPQPLAWRARRGLGPVLAAGSAQQRAWDKLKRALAFQIGGGAGAAKAGRAALTAPIRASWEHPQSVQNPKFPLAGRRPARRSGGAFHPAWSEGGAVRQRGANKNHYPCLALKPKHCCHNRKQCCIGATRSPREFKKARHLRLPMRAKAILACGANHPPTPRTCSANHPPAPWLMRHLQKRTGGGVLLRPGHPGALQRHAQAGPEALPCGWSARARWRDGAASYFKAARLRRNFRLPGLHPRLPESHFRILEFHFRLLEFHFRLPGVPGARAGGFAALYLGPSALDLRPAPAGLRAVGIGLAIEL